MSFPKQDGILAHNVLPLCKWSPWCRAPCKAPVRLSCIRHAVLHAPSPLQVVVNVPLSDKTRGMFNDETVGKMKKGAILVRDSHSCSYDQLTLQENPKPSL
jgi:D-isomer specific 2-hydroxyacid dehydrogenase, NAD binding domain